MKELTASRTLVKSPPELWAECSDAASLSRHLAQFGEIRITRLEPETVVAWEGESASGTVRLEPSGWGTRVVLTAEAVVAEPVVEEVEVHEPVTEEPAVQEPIQEPPQPEEEEPPRGRGFARLLRWFRRRRAVDPDPVALPEPEPAIERDAPPEDREQREDLEQPEEPVPPVAGELLALEQALDSLGQAHHRPFSRA
jgi:hypothetical protein